MEDVTATTRARIEAQGFVGLDTRTLTQINYWLRLAPAICMAWTAVGVSRIRHESVGTRPVCRARRSATGPSV
jgi:hypothetical protein